MQKYEHGRLVNIGEIYKISRIRMGSDGPGMSTLVAFRECQLKCVYCLNEHCHVLQAMLEEVDKKIAGADYSASFVALQKDVSIYQKEYAEVLDNKWEKRPLKEKKVLKNGMYQYEYDNAIDCCLAH